MASVPFYKIVDENGYIPGFGTNGNDEFKGLEPIKKEEYDQLMEMMKSRPDQSKAPSGYDWILNNNPLEWVQIEIKKK